MLTLSIEKGKYVRRIEMIRDRFYVECTRRDFVYVGKPRPSKEISEELEWNMNQYLLPNVIFCFSKDMMILLSL